MPEPLWIPSAERVEAAAITAFAARAENASGDSFGGYFDLHEWSIRDIGRFWEFYLEDSSLPFTGEYQGALSREAMPEVRWFDGVRLNYARSLLYPAGVSPLQPAIIAVDETGTERVLDYAELRRLVARVQSSLESEGIGEGDRVAAFAANVPETVALMLACASLGAIFTSCSPDFGFEAAHARFAQVSPRMLFASTVYRYGGRRFDVSEVVSRLAGQLGVERTVLMPYPGEQPTVPSASLPWDDWLAPRDGEPEFRDLPFDHPLYVLYSSGTTGAPKAIVHRAGGVLLTHHKEHRLHSDVRAGDRVAYYTTCGWMMWNWLVSALSLGAAIVLIEGSPAYPRVDSLFTWAERLRLNFLGTSARYLHTLQARDCDLRGLDLTALRTIASTGSPLSPGGFEFVYRRILADVHLASISGGTDIVGCFMLGVPTLPVHAGQIQAPGLGVDLAAYDEEGRPVTGRPGELVCRQPLPSMPLGFWNDPDRRRYREAYFAHYPGVWRHGDLIEITPERGIVVHGRSDATLNPGGVRIGTAEIYRPLEALPEVIEAVAVGRREGGDESIWLFVVLSEGLTLDDDLAARIKLRIRQGASPRHVPQRIFQVRELPRTRSGKVMELAVARLINGQPLANREVVANPEALDEVAAVVRAVTGTARR